MVFNLFKRKKSPENIKIKDIDNWLKHKYESKNLSLKIGVLKRELISKKTKIIELLEELQETNIKDASVIPERAKSMFEGNRSAYIQKVTTYLKELEYPEDVSLIESFLEDSSLKLDDLAKDTNKNYFIIKEFAEDEVRAVNLKIKELDKLISSTRAEIEKTPLTIFRELKLLVPEYHASVAKINEQKNILNSIIEKKVEELDRKLKIEAKIVNLKKSPQHGEYVVLKTKKESLNEDLKKSEYEIIELFSGISSVLKKYGKTKKNELANSYADDAVSALLADDDFEIIKIIENVLKVKDSLDIKSTKLKKLEITAKNINKKSLNNLKNNLIKLQTDLNYINNRLKNHSFALNLKEQEGRLLIIEANFKDIEREEREVEEVLEKLNPRLIKQKMNSLIKKIDENTTLI